MGNHCVEVMGKVQASISGAINFDRCLFSEMGTGNAQCCSGTVTSAGEQLNARRLGGPSAALANLTVHASNKRFKWEPCSSGNSGSRMGRRAGEGFGFVEKQIQILVACTAA